MPYNRQALVKRYIELVTYAERAFGMTNLPQIKTNMTDDEIVRLGLALKDKIDDAEKRVAEHKRLLGV